MKNHRNKQNYRLRTWTFRDRCHLKGGVRQGCFLSLIHNYLIQYIHFHSLYIMSHYYAKFKENPCVGTDASTPFDFLHHICFHGFGLIWFFTSQSTAIVLSGRSVHLAKLFSWARLTKQLTSTSCTYFRLRLTTTLLESAEGRRITVEMKKVNKQCLFDTPPPHTKIQWKTWQVIFQTSRKEDFSRICANKNYKLLHAYVQCVYIVSAKYQIAQSKAVVGVELPIKALSMHIQKAI